MASRILLRATGLICVALGLTACGGSSFEDGDARGKVPQFPAESRAAAHRLLEETHLVCSDESDCPRNVGLVTAIVLGEDGDQPRVGRCTGWLVAPDVIATNSHCIPTDLKSKLGPSCADRLNVTFRDDERIGCAEILHASDLGGESSGVESTYLHADFAFVRLEKKSAAEPLARSHEGLADELPVRVLKVDPLSEDKPDGLLKPTSCRAAQNTVVVPQFSTDTYVHATLIDCQVISGNSGAPVVDAEGIVRAIVWGSVSPDTKRKVGLVYETSGLRDVYFATNWACVRAPGEGDEYFQATDASCEARTKLTAGLSGLEPSAYLQTRLNEAAAQIHQRLREWKEEIKSGSNQAPIASFRWAAAVRKDETTKLRRLVTVKPVCVDAATFRPGAGQEGTPARLDVVLRRWTVRVGLDAEYRPLVSVRPRDYAATLSFDFEKLKQDGKGDYDLEAPMSPRSCHQGELSTCEGPELPDEEIVLPAGTPAG